jgi:hypothetical protein
MSKLKDGVCRTISDAATQLARLQRELGGGLWQLLRLLYQPARLGGFNILERYWTVSMSIVKRIVLT